MSLTIYLAAPWVRKKDAAVVRQQLRDRGFNVTSRWIDLPDDSAQDDEKYMTSQAVVDLEDVHNSDCVVVMNWEKSEGKAVEQGLAIAWDMPLLIVGDRSNIFQYLPSVLIVPTLDEAIIALHNLEDLANASPVEN